MELHVIDTALVDAVAAFGASVLLKTWVLLGVAWGAAVLLRRAAAAVRHAIWSAALLPAQSASDHLRYFLPAGTHAIRLRNREDRARLDKLLVTNAPTYTPRGRGEAARKVEVFFQPPANDVAP